MNVDLVTTHRHIAADTSVLSENITSLCLLMTEYTSQSNARFPLKIHLASESPLVFYTYLQTCLRAAVTCHVVQYVSIAHAVV